MDDQLLDIQKKVAGQEILLSRVDAALDKISEVSLNVSKLLAVHEQRLEAQEESTKKLPDLIEQRRVEAVHAQDVLHSRVTSSEQRLRQEMAEGQKEILSEIKNLRSDMSELGDELKEQTETMKTDLEEDFSKKIDEVTGRVTKLERLSWLVVGGATVIGFILSQALGVIQLFTGG